MVAALKAADSESAFGLKLLELYANMGLLKVFSPLAPPYLAVGDGVTDDTAALTALLAAVPEDSTIDLGGLEYAVTSALAWNKRVNLRNGKLIGGTHAVGTISADDVTWTRVAWERSTSAATSSDTLPQRSGLVVSAERFSANECIGIDANHAPLYLSNGLCNGSQVLGGTYENSSARQNACLIYAAAGAVENGDLLVERIKGTGTGCPEGVLLYDCSSSKISRNTLTSFRRLPTVTLTGWTLVSGNIYRTTERTDGLTRVLKDNGTERTENTSTPATPGSNQWGNSGGYVYLNLGGTDPATVKGQ